MTKAQQGIDSLNFLTEWLYLFAVFIVSAAVLWFTRGRAATALALWKPKFAILAAFLAWLQRLLGGLTVRFSTGAVLITAIAAVLANLLNRVLLSLPEGTHSFTGGISGVVDALAANTLENELTEDA